MKISRSQIACPDSGSGLVPGDFSVAKCLSQNSEEHFLSQLTRLSVPGTGMIGADDYRDFVAKPQHSSVAEFCGGLRKTVLVPNRSHYSVEGELSQAENCLHVSQRVYFVGEIRGAVARLHRGWLVVGRSALDRGCHIRAL